MENVTQAFKTTLPRCVYEELNDPEMCRVIYLKSGFVTDYAGYIRQQELVSKAKNTEAGAVATFKLILSFLSLVEHIIFFLFMNKYIHEEHVFKFSNHYMNYLMS